MQLICIYKIAEFIVNCKLVAFVILLHNKDYMKAPNFHEVLRQHGHKATPGRILLLEILFAEKKPVAVAYLEQKIGHLVDTVTLYRALESLVASGIVQEVDFRHGHAHYELKILRKHHHHIICTSCNFVEDVDCGVQGFVAQSSKKTKRFNTLNDHALEFFGTCAVCATHTV